jgi:uncharacterized repeat protein (TIGR01451 family)
MIRRFVISLSVFTVLLGAFSSMAGASAPAPAWGIRSISRPTNLAPGTSFGTNPEFNGNQSDYYSIIVTNIGGAPTDRGVVTVTDRLPAGLALATAGARLVTPSFGNGHQIGECTAAAQTVTCTTSEEVTVEPGKSMLMTVPLEVSESAPPTVANVVSVSGGGAPTASATEPTTISPVPAAFGLQDREVIATGPDGAPDAQAGSHPLALTTTLDFDTKLNSLGVLTTSADLRDVEVALPPGFVGNTAAVPQCSQTSLAETEGEGECPEGTQIGVATLLLNPIGEGHPAFETVPIVNLVPRPGVPAELGFNASGLIVHLTPRVRADDYGLTVSSLNTSQVVRLFGVSTTVWGVPYSRSNDAERGRCLYSEAGEEALCPAREPPRPFLTMPPSCTGPLAYGIALDSWQDPGAQLTQVLSENASGEPQGLDGCNRLEFEPSLSLAPETSATDTATGVTADVKVPQAGLLNPEGIAAADIRDTTVVLPRGVTVNPGQAAGLSACQPAEDAVGTESAPSCPAASQLGTVEIETPLLPDKLEGKIYLLRSNPPDLQILLAASADGVNVKLIGDVHLDESTDQLTTTFANTPQLPFTDLKLHFAGGPRAALVTPSTCGTYTTTSDFTPSSSPSGADATPSSSFAIDQNCQAASKFTPALQAGVASPVAGAGSSFALKLTREDGQQNVSRIQATLPEGELAKLSGVPLCPAAQAPSGECPASSQIGTTTVAVGPGSDPLYIPQPGKSPTAVYLSGPYQGAPYSLVVKTPAQAGPFDLGDVVVRAALAIDPVTTQVTATSDPLPQSLLGVPLQYRTIYIDVDRPDFMRNPTNCEPMSVSAAITSDQGTRADLSSHFQVGDCGALAFKPSLKLSLKGATKRSGVPALKAVLSFPDGNNANVHSVSTVLPRSEFIDNAHIGNTCTRVQFNAGAGGGAECPAKSVLGKAIAYSPLLEEPLEGTVYLRSNGGERELPDLVAALKGQIDVTLVGFIDSVKKSKHSEVSRIRTRFMNVPDAPVSRFVLQLAGAKKGLLQNSANLCKVKNIAQVKAVGQNGKTYDTEPVVTNDCGRKGKKPKAH